MILRLCLIAVILASTASAISAGMTLVKNGRPNCTIIITPTAGDQLKLAANDLQLYLSKMSGATTPITKDKSVAGNRVLLGIYGQSPVEDWTGEKPKSDAFAIETKSRAGGDSDLYLVGGDWRGVQYAVYELLERFLGARWYMPCDLGEEVPARKTIKLKNLKWRNEPDYVAIGGLIWAGGPCAGDWLRHNKGDVGSPNYFFGHSWDGYIAPTDENKAAHPEWFALDDQGARSHQLCTSNPEVVQIFIDKINEFFDKNPDAVLTSISPNDGGGFCTCDKCKAIDAQYGVNDGSQTDRFIHFANTILKETKKRHPDKMVGILAYVTHTRPPVSAVPDDNYATTICHMPWEFCHVHAITDPKCKVNSRFREMIEGWAKVCKHVGVYDYYGHFYIMTPWPILHDIARDVPYLRRIGVTAFQSETQQHWCNQGLNFYLAAKLMWDTDRDPKAILDDYYRGFYGPAKKPMREYWETWEAAMVKQPCGGYAWLAMLTPELMETTDKLLKEAEKLAADNKKVSERLALHRIGHRFAVAYTDMRWYGEKGDLEKAVECGKEAVRIVENTKKLKPQAFFWQLASDQTGIQMLQYKRKLDAQKAAKPKSDDSKEPQKIFGSEEK